ncbi:MAG: zinc ribbon domain-containing protein [Candidatus Hodarchaeota archaeon]
MFCTKCGGTISDDAKFCPNCGEDLTEVMDIIKENSSTSDISIAESDFKISLEGDANVVLNMIKEELQNPKPKTKTILKYLIDLRANKKISQPSDSEFFDIVGVTFKLNPDFFMKEIYETFMVKMGNIIGTEKRREMEKYIIEKFCLAEGEQILYECKGNIKQTEILEQKPSGKYEGGLFPIRISVSLGDFFLTNYRLIAHGSFKVKGGESKKLFLWTSSIWVFSGGSKRRERKRALIESSPLFGYQFSIKNHWGLVKVKFTHVVLYNINVDNRKCLISIKPTDKSKREEDMSKIFDLLRKDANEFLDVIQEIMEFEKSEKMKRRLIWGNLKALHKSEEFTGLSDLDYLNIVKETYELDPEFFMTSIYPKMTSWNDESFLSIKEELFALLSKEGAKIN